MAFFILASKSVQSYKKFLTWESVSNIPLLSIIITDKDVAKETWYLLDGKLLGRPEPGKINIRVTTYTDVTTQNHKVAVPQE